MTNPKQMQETVRKTIQFALHQPVAWKKSSLNWAHVNLVMRQTRCVTWLSDGALRSVVSAFHEGLGLSKFQFSWHFMQVAFFFLCTICNLKRLLASWDLCWIRGGKYQRYLHKPLRSRFSEMKSKPAAVQEPGREGHEHRRDGVSSSPRFGRRSGQGLSRT